MDIKHLLSCMVVIAFSLPCYSQVDWTFSANKIKDKTYEIHLKATVPEPWHIYSQSSPEAGPLPTHITLNKNPLILKVGNMKEVGDMATKFEEVFNVDVKFYTGQVEFVQLVKLKSNVKTNVSGTVEYMICNESECMPPMKEKFTVKLN